jgi:hypothetical protein
MNWMVLSFAAVLAIAIAELILSWKWNRSYFSFGIPIFLRRVERPSGLAGVDLDELPKSCATAAGAPMVFHRLGTDRIAFREKPFGGLIHYSALMRGVIRHQPEESSVVVVGLMQWYAVALLVVVAVALGAGIVAILPLIGLAFGVLYLIQGVRFYRIANALRTDATHA